MLASILSIIEHEHYKGVIIVSSILVNAISKLIKISSIKLNTILYVFSLSLHLSLLLAQRNPAVFPAHRRTVR